MIVLLGAGGVGKTTTTAAAMGLRAAERHQHVVVLTVDPADGLAQAMGLSCLDNIPRPVNAGLSLGGSLHAMMLDMKRTFDEIVEAHTDPDRAGVPGQSVLPSLYFQASGTQEYMAMEKLGQLHRTDEWDLIVVDTPPSRSALDFLDAPERLGRFLDGRLIRLLTAPAKPGRAYLKMLNAGFSLVTGTHEGARRAGTQGHADVRHGLQHDVRRLPQQGRGDLHPAPRTPGTSFIVVAAPEPDALREASYFAGAAERRGGSACTGLILNRVHVPAATRLSAAHSIAAAEALENHETPDGTAEPAIRAYPRYALTAGVLRLHAERMQLAIRERRVARRLRRPIPPFPVAAVAAQPEDVHDLEGLRPFRLGLASEPVAGWPVSSPPGSRLLLVALPGLLEQLAPGLYVGTAPQQRPALPLGHSAPHAEFDAVVQRVGPGARS